MMAPICPVQSCPTCVGSKGAAWTACGVTIQALEVQVFIIYTPKELGLLQLSFYLL